MGFLVGAGAVDQTVRDVRRGGGPPRHRSEMRAHGGGDGNRTYQEPAELCSGGGNAYGAAPKVHFYRHDFGQSSERRRLVRMGIERKRLLGVSTRGGESDNNPGEFAA